ncbi:MAG: C39 family peptidase [Candidatus Komeilibacteria bacterium]
MKKIIVLFILTLLLIVVYFQQERFVNYFSHSEKTNLPKAVSFQDLNVQIEDIDLIEVASVVDEIVPETTIVEEINLDVPFMVQAPEANWDLPYQEACEEASLIMLHYYWQGKELTTALAEQEIQDLIAWQIDKLGDYKDTTIEQTAWIAENYWHYQTEIVEDPSVESIKEYLSLGYPVIAPFYGKAIGNPYYSGDGPLYHMLVIKGFYDDQLITNDPGTKRGADYVYGQQLLSAMHDWYDGDVVNGPARILIVK